MEKCASETICFSSGTVFDDDGNAQCYTTFTGTLKNCACKKGYVGNSCEYKSDGYCGDNVLNTKDCDEMYIHALDQAQKKFFLATHQFDKNSNICYDTVKALERRRKGGERRMIQCELSSSLENSNQMS